MVANNSMRNAKYPGAARFRWLKPRCSAALAAALALMPSISWAILYDCSGATFEYQIADADLIVIAHIAEGSPREKYGAYELDVYKRWKGTEERFTYKTSGFSPKEFFEGEFYLLFLHRSDEENTYTKWPCYYGDYVVYSAEALRALGEPTWSLTK